MNQLVSEMYAKAIKYRARHNEWPKGYVVHVDDEYVRRRTLKGLRKVLESCFIDLSKVKVFVNPLQEVVVDLAVM